MWGYFLWVEGPSFLLSSPQSLKGKRRREKKKKKKSFNVCLPSLLPVPNRVSEE